MQDYFSAVYHNFPYVLLIIALITFLLLVRTFRSLLLPIKAVVLNLVSLSAVFGAIVFFWQHGHGANAVFGVSPTGAITFWLPVIIFAFLFGLSMDYEVFILVRMREAYDDTGSTAQAVVTGLGRTGRLVTSAALILFFAFAALGFLARHRHQGARDRPRRRHPHRRHPGPRVARAGSGQPVRPLELVAAQRDWPARCGWSLRRSPPRVRSPASSTPRASGSLAATATLSPAWASVLKDAALGREPGRASPARLGRRPA